MECDPGDDRHAYDLVLEEEYIDMDVSSSAYLCYTAGSPPHSIEFEFHMAANPLEREPITSPADELFYKGKLLPLHLPPRLQMVQRLLQNPSTTFHRSNGDSASPAAGNTTASTPFTSRNISPVSSCYVSGELSPEVYFDCSASFDQPLPKKSWTKKLKQMRQAALGLKLKASREYLKSLFTRPAARAEEQHAVRRGRGELAGRGTKAGKKNPFGLTSVNSEAECSIQGAIAYCKKTQVSACSRKSFSDVGSRTLSPSRVAAACET
ncbi:hypothetical protein Taro_039663 [Colocasia esculenta]|uniref:Membrane-associated kinase regulator 4 n=1 Tax=Colocasia esculenta TaxID=4460 RepID=A0A843WJK1_COLES|nr:hypothetical protein [Colocasia esculenta]